MSGQKVTFYTTASERYDGFSVRSVWDGRKRTFCGKPARKVSLEPRDAVWFESRCGSGMEPCMREDRWQDFVRGGEATEELLPDHEVAAAALEVMPGLEALERTLMDSYGKRDSLYDALTEVCDDSLSNSFIPQRLREAHRACWTLLAAANKGCGFSISPPEEE